MRNHDHHDPSLSKALEQLEQRSPLQAAPTNKAQNERICRMALEQIRTEASSNTADTIAFPAQKAGPYKTARRVRRPLRVGLVAAALLCFGSISVYAVGTQLLPMLSERVSFFADAPSQQQADNAADAPRGGHSSHALVETFNTAVGTTVESSGISLTLDNVSMDISGVDAFFTADAPEIIQQLIDKNDYAPLWDVLGGGAFFEATLNGTPLAGSPVASDWYRTEDGKVKFMVHFLLPQLPEGEQLNLQLHSSYLFDQEGDWNFQVALDGASVRSGGKIGASGLHPLPADEEQDNKDLDLVYLAFGPRGGAMMTRSHYWADIPEGSSVPLFSGYNGSTPDDFMITDNTGKTLYATNTNYCDWQEQDEANYFIADLTLPDPAATSITLTPMLRDSNTDMTVTTQQLKEGLDVPTGPESGFHIKNFVQEGSSFRWELEPYGYGPFNLELIPHDDELVTTTSNGRFGLVSSVLDSQTGIYSCRLDYYAATAEEVASITEWHIPISQNRPDHEHAVTIPLSDLPSEG